MAGRDRSSGPHGRVSAYLGWALLILAFLGFLGMLRAEDGYPRLGGTLVQIIGLWLGMNVFALCAFLLALYAGILQKNQAGRVLLIGSGILLAASTVLSAMSWRRQASPEALEFVSSADSEFQVAFPHTYRKRVGYIGGLEVLAYETEATGSPHLRVEFTPLAGPATQVPDLRAMLENYARLAGLLVPEITIAQSPVGRVGTYSGAKTVGEFDFKVYGKVIIGTRSMVSCVVVEPLPDFPSIDSTVLLGNIRRK